MIEQAPFYCGDCLTPCMCMELMRCMAGPPEPEGDDEPEADE